jgi:phage terminase large subunit GpA-like protein
VSGEQQSAAAIEAAERAARAAAVFGDGWRAGWKPEPRRTVSEWADTNRRLTSEASSEAGQWETSRVPYLREIMDALSPHHPAREVVFMSSTQVGKTECGLNWIGQTIEDDPCPMLVVMPTSNMAKRFSKQRLAPMLRESPSLRRLVASAFRARDASNTLLSKEYPGGGVNLAGANSAAELSSAPIRKLHCDEVDRYPYEIENEGDPLTLAVRRTSNFPRRKIFYSSSPTIESLSRINQLYEKSDQRRYFVPCPDCDEMQVLQWENLMWERGNPAAGARYRCEACGVLIEEYHKTAMLAAGEWRATHAGRSIVGFQINALYSPIGLGDTWADHAETWERIERDPSKVKSFNNTVLGICNKDPNEKLDWKAIKDRAEPYKLRTVPRGVFVITAGVDVQGNRLAVQLVGWGRDESAWVLDWVELPGDPTREDVWNRLDELLLAPLVNEYGINMRVTACAVDAGYLQDRVLAFTRKRTQRNVFAVIGVAGVNKAIIMRATKPDRNRKGRTAKRSVDLWHVSSSAAKEWLFLRIADDAKKTAAEDRLVHFSAELPEEYFTQLCAEIYDPRQRVWVKQQARNEALDTKVYARAAAMHPNLRVHTYREAEWAKLESVLQPQSRDLFSAPAPDQTPAAQPAEAIDLPAGKRRRRMVSRGIN